MSSPQPFAPPGVECARIHPLKADVIESLRSGARVPGPVAAIEGLICNALDAACTSVVVTVCRETPLTFSVADNGTGISKADMAKLGQRHFTRVDGDGGGETLASLAVLSEALEVSSRRSDNYEATVVRYEKGLPAAASGAGVVVPAAEHRATAGTTVRVETLFAALPVRRRLHERTPFARHVRGLEDAVRRLSLGRAAAVSLRLVSASDGEVIYQKRAAKPEDGLRGCFADLFGVSLAAKMEAVRGEGGGDGNDGRFAYSVDGLVSVGNVAAARDFLRCLLLNGRPVRCTLLEGMLAKLYGRCRREAGGGGGGYAKEYAQKGSLHPVYAIRLEVPDASLYDVAAAGSSAGSGEQQVLFRPALARRLAQDVYLKVAVALQKHRISVPGCLGIVDGLWLSIADALPQVLPQVATEGEGEDGEVEGVTPPSLASSSSPPPVQSVHHPTHLDLAVSLGLFSSSITRHAATSKPVPFRPDASASIVAAAARASGAAKTAKPIPFAPPQPAPAAPPAEAAKPSAAAAIPSTPHTAPHKVHSPPVAAASSDSPAAKEASAKPTLSLAAMFLKAKAPKTSPTDEEGCGAGKLHHPCSASAAASSPFPRPTGPRSAATAATEATARTAAAAAAAASSSHAAAAVPGTGVAEVVLPLSSLPPSPSPTSPLPPPPPPPPPPLVAPPPPTLLSAASGTDAGEGGGRVVGRMPASEILRRAGLDSDGDGDVAPEPVMIVKAPPAMVPAAAAAPPAKRARLVENDDEGGGCSSGCPSLFAPAAPLAEVPPPHHHRPAEPPRRIGSMVPWIRKRWYDLKGTVRAANAAQRIDPGVEVSRADAAALRVIGQAHRQFVFCVLEETGLICAVDPHAADERLKFEALREALPGLVRAKAARSTACLVLTRGEAAGVLQQVAALRRWGWEVEVAAAGARGDDDDDDGRGAAEVRLLVTSTPEVVFPDWVAEPRTVSLAAGSVRQAAVELENGGCSAVPTAFYRLLASKACRSAVMFGAYMSHEECRALVRRLAAAKDPFHCAHGRPCIVPLCRTPALPHPLEALPQLSFSSLRSVVETAPRLHKLFQ